VKRGGEPGEEEKNVSTYEGGTRWKRRRKEKDVQHLLVEGKKKGILREERKKKEMWCRQAGSPDEGNSKWRKTLGGKEGGTFCRKEREGRGEKNETKRVEGVKGSSGLRPQTGGGKKRRKKKKGGGKK